MINRDVPGMIGFASQKIGAHGINISSYLNASNGAVGYNIIDLGSPVPESVVKEIAPMKASFAPAPLFLQIRTTSEARKRQCKSKL